MVTQQDIKDDLSYLKQMKNRHEERLSQIEKSIPEDLSKRLRDVELKVYVISTVVPVVVTLLMKYVLKD